MKVTPLVAGACGGLLMGGVRYGTAFYDITSFGPRAADRDHAHGIAGSVVCGIFTLAALKNPRFAVLAGTMAGFGIGSLVGVHDGLHELDVRRRAVSDGEGR